jgi:hypothetical protein
VCRGMNSQGIEMKGSKGCGPEGTTEQRKRCEIPARVCLSGQTCSLGTSSMRRLEKRERTPDAAQAL